MVRKIIWTGFLSLLLLSSCGISIEEETAPATEVTEEGPHRFDIISVEEPYNYKVDNNFVKTIIFSTFVDHNTGCKYIVVNQNRQFGMTALIKEDGTPDCGN